jgi:hypothetical protein
MKARIAVGDAATNMPICDRGNFARKTWMILAAAWGFSFGLWEKPQGAITGGTPVPHGVFVAVGR